MNTSFIEDAAPFLRVYLPFVFAVGSIFYFAPAWIGRYKGSFWSIFVLNFLFGWTIFGWLIALIWSVTPDRSKPALLYRDALLDPSMDPIVAPPLVDPEQPVSGDTADPEGWKPLFVGAALSILTVAILFGIFSRGEFPLSLSTKTPTPQVAAAD